MVHSLQFSWSNPRNSASVTSNRSFFSCCALIDTYEPFANTAIIQRTVQKVPRADHGQAGSRPGPTGPVVFRQENSASHSTSRWDPSEDHTTYNAGLAAGCRVSSTLFAFILHRKLLLLPSSRIPSRQVGLRGKGIMRSRSTRVT